MALSMSEIRKRAIEFAKEWEDAHREKAESQTFWNEFFNVFGVSRKRVAIFEQKVASIVKDGERGFIDLFWPGMLIVEQKSRGGDLDSAFQQGVDYAVSLKQEELPKYIIVSDFERIRLIDLEEKADTEFKLSELHKNIELFGFIAGYTKHKQHVEDPVNIAAAELMGRLHDELKASGYTGHILEIFLVRILFCLFADDTGIFRKESFLNYIHDRTNEDGSDLGIRLAMLFQVLNTPNEQRQSTLEEEVRAFPYVNGKLYEEQLPLPSFNSRMRDVLLTCCAFDWSAISPAIFGSMFQSVMNQDERHDLGAHYTSEANIMKIVRSLFLDDLRAEFEKKKTEKPQLYAMLERIKKMKFLDPACGCGNFLITAYKEIRLLEIDIHKQIKSIEGHEDAELDISRLAGIDVDAMAGIEISEFAARIAEVAMWLIDHQMNMKLSETFGQYFARLPLKKSAKIVNGNALRLDWETIVPKNELTYMLGNPPFIGKKGRDTVQNEDMDLVFNGINGYGILDYVCAWYIKAARYIKDTKITVAFVSTNSIVQGEQVGVLGQFMIDQGIKIHFAHRSFDWTNEARHNAAVYVVIVGFAAYDTSNKMLFDYKTPTSEPMAINAKNINAYLINNYDFILPSRNNPICEVPEITFGNMPNDDGNFLFTDDEKNEFLKREPKAKPFMCPIISAKEFLHNERRWCLWLKNISPTDLKSLPCVLERVEKVKEYRLSSNREATKKLAQYPYLFGEIRQPQSHYVLIPRHSSENRLYVPMGFFNKNYIVADSCNAVPNATLYHFGVLVSMMHMVWMRQVCGRLESRYRYSNNIVYNNFPWPESPPAVKVKAVEEAAKEVLDAREKYPDSSLADLYDPVAMPKVLVDAHRALDKAVDLCYRPQAFTKELLRLEFLFDLYRKYTAPLAGDEGKKKSRVVTSYAK